MEILEKKQLDVLIDEKIIYSFNMQLAKFVTIKNAELYSNQA
jgi:hypothetical protein